MEKPTILSEADIQIRLQDLKGWIYTENKLRKEFTFKDFIDSLNFVVHLAPFFETNDHHPDVHIFYSKVIFELQRFDVGGKVTDTDFIVATEIERVYGERI